MYLSLKRPGEEQQAGLQGFPSYPSEVSLTDSVGTALLSVTPGQLSSDFLRASLFLKEVRRNV